VHELAICQGIIEVASEALRAERPPCPAVASVTVQIGRLTAAVPASLRVYFALLTPGTPLEGARLVIEEVPIRGLCADCARPFEIDTLTFTCPRCGSGFVELTSGRELRVVSLETAEEVLSGDSCSP
jgi:hydrogenase nickel incorporation protein HypA/HybF